MVRETELARNALITRDFDQFFSIINTVDRYNVFSLIKEASDLAIELKNVELLQRLLLIDCEDSWDKKRIFRLVIKGLLQLKADALVTHLVIFPPAQSILPSDAWVEYAEELLECNRVAEFERIFLYIQENYEQEQLAIKCLQKISASEDILKWLYWYGKAMFLHQQQLNSKNDSYHSDYSCKLCKSDIKNAVIICADLAEFDNIIKLLADMPDSPGKQRLLRALYLLCLASARQHLDKLQGLLPENLSFLTDFNSLQYEFQHWKSFRSLSADEATPLINVAITTTVQSYQADDKGPISYIVEKAAEVKNHRQMIVTTAIRVAIECEKYGLAIALLGQVGTYERVDQIKLIPLEPLTTEQITSINSSIEYV